MMYSAYKLNKQGDNIVLVYSFSYLESVCCSMSSSNCCFLTCIQIPIEMGYRIAKLFAGKSPEAKKNAELLGLMVNDPNVKPEELARIQCPTLVVAGSKDMIKEEHTRLIARSIPEAQLVIVPGDHFVANKNPDAFNEAVLHFLL